MPGLILTISAEAVNRTKLIPAGWHNGEIESFTYEKNKNSEGHSYVANLKVIDDPANNGAVKRAQWGEQYPEYMAEFLLSLGFEKQADGSINVNVPSLDDFKGRKVAFKTFRDSYQGKDQDKVTNFMPYGSN